MNTLPDVDIAIVGGGISGIYTGWKLRTQNLGKSPPAEWAGKRDGGLKVAVYEGTTRIGGRLLSARSPNMPDSTAELGGMRYVSPAQTLVKDLVENVLDLPRHEQTVDVPTNIAYLRDQLLRTRDLANPASLPYKFSPSEANWLSAHPGNSPAALIVRVLTDLMPEIPAKLKEGTDKLREYLEGIKFPDGLMLWQHGLWNLLAKHISTDGLAAARTTVGYDCLGGNTNALDLTTEFFDFVKGVKYMMVNDGYERVPWELQHRFTAAGGEIYFENWLDGFEGTTLADGSRGVRLHFEESAKVKARTLTARAIVLAMPRRSIELLRPEGELLGPQNVNFREDLASVSGIPLSKLFLLYPRSWWQEAGVSDANPLNAGRSLTDMPLRQCYYWPTGTLGPDGNPLPPAPDAPGLVMAYDDLMSVGFWGGLDTRRETHKAGLPQSKDYSGRYTWPLFKPDRPKRPPAADPYAKQLMDNWTHRDVTQPMVDELHRQLVLMHGIDDAPMPIDAAYMDWSRDPYGGGVHLWNVNYRSETLLYSMAQPMKDFPCYICGEAYSTNQTWAEGALQTAEIVLNRLLHRPTGEGK